MSIVLRTLVLALLVGGCVPKSRHLRELDVVKQAQASTETQLGLTRDQLSNAQRTLEAETRGAAELRAQIDQQVASNQTLQERLQKLSEELSALGTRSATRKAELESMVQELSADAETSRQQAQKAAERAAVLDAERKRLAEETARLQAEKAALEATTEEYDRLVGQLKSEIDSGQVTITELSGRLTVNVSNNILFDSGSIAVKPAGKEALIKVASVLTGLKDREIRVEGHTDDVPVNRGAAYSDNWALSALRASGVVSILVANGVDPLDVGAVGFGEFRPVVANDTKENKAQNRRTEIVLVPRLK